MGDPQPVTEWRDVDIAGIPYQVRTHPDKPDDIICAVRPWGGRPPDKCSWKAYHFPPTTNPRQDPDAYRVRSGDGRGGCWPDAQTAMDAADAARLSWAPHTDLTDCPVCPHCGGEDQDWWDGLRIEVNDGTEWRAHCHDCGQDYTVTACVEVTFSTAKVPNEETPDDH